MAKKGELLIDTTRNLCDSCKHNYPDCDGDPEFGTNIGNDNVIRCTSYVKKPKSNVSRLENGKEFWVYILKDEKISLNELIPNKRIEDDKNRINSLYYEIGNYFYTEGDCLKEIERVTKLKNK